MEESWKLRALAGSTGGLRPALRGETVTDGSLGVPWTQDLRRRGRAGPLCTARRLQLLQGGESISSHSPVRWERCRDPLRIPQGARPQASWGREEILTARTLEGDGGEVGLTTSMKRVQMSKLGFFRRFLMTQDCTVWPPHSTTRLGEDTLASW